MESNWIEAGANASTFEALLPETILLFGVVMLMIIPNLGKATFRIPLTQVRVPCLIGGRRFKLTSDPRLPSLISILTLLTALIAALMSQASGAERYFLTGGEGDDLRVLLKVDGFSRLFELMFFGALLIAAVASINRLPANPSAKDTEIQDLLNNRRQVDFHILLLMTALGMAIVALAMDLFMLFIGLELASLATYVLVAFHKESKAGSEGGVKYFIVGAISSAIGLYGMSLLYIWHGNLQIASNKIDLGDGQSFVIDGLDSAWASMGATEVLPILALGLMLVGFAFKVSAVPFHFAAPDAYSGASSPVAGVLATASKAMGFLGLLRVLMIVTLPGTESSTVWLIAMGVIAVITMTWGNLAALSSDNPKRMLAYSSIAHAGYMLAALTAVGAWKWGEIQIPQEAADWLVAAVIFHLVVLVTFKLGAFLVLAMLEIEGGAHRMSSLSGLAKRDPLIAVSMFIFMLALAGVPPLAGFMSKFLLIVGIIKMSAGDAGTLLTQGSVWSLSDMHWTFWLAASVFLNSALSLYYYLRVGVVMFFEEPERHHRLPKAWFLRLTIWACALGTIIFGLAGSGLLDLCLNAADSLFSLS